MNTNTRQSLLKELQGDGSDAAWLQFTEIYETLLNDWLRRSGLQDADIDDLRQEVLEVVVSEIGNFQHNGRPGAFRTWLRRILANRLHRLWRRKSVEQRNASQIDLGQLANELEHDTSQSSGDWDREYNRAVVERLMERLHSRFSEKHVIAFERIAIHGDDIHTIARDLDMTVGAIRVAYHRIFKRLKQYAGELIE